MAPTQRLKGHARLSAAFDSVFEKKGTAAGFGIKKATSRAAARAARNASHEGKYKCILCGKGFSRRSTVFDPHFAGCVRKNGNPKQYAWDEDPSCWKRNDGPSGVTAPGLDEFNQPVDHNSKGNNNEKIAMTNFFVENKHKMDSPSHPVFNFADLDYDAGYDAEYDAEEGMDLDSEPSSASTIVPDTAFFVRGNPVVIANTATGAPEATVPVPQTAFQAPSAAAKIVRREIEVPDSSIKMPAPAKPYLKPVSKDMDARGLVTYEVAPHTEDINPRLLDARKHPNMISASGLAFDSFRYMIGNPGKAVHHDIHGKKPAAGFRGKVSSKTMLKITNIVIEACRVKAAISNEDAKELFEFFKKIVTTDLKKMKYRHHPHKPPVSIKTLTSMKALPLSPALGRAHRVQKTTYMVQDVYTLMLKHSESLMHQMQCMCLWRDVLSAIGAHRAIQEVHVLLSRELGEMLPLILEAVDKFSNVL